MALCKNEGQEGMKSPLGMDVVLYRIEPSLNLFRTILSKIPYDLTGRVAKVLFDNLLLPQ